MVEISQSKRILRVSLVNGLGNQLFQVAAAMDLSRQFDVRCVFTLPSGSIEYLQEDTVLGLENAPLMRSSKFRQRKRLARLEELAVYRRASAKGSRLLSRLSRGIWVDDFGNARSRAALLSGLRPRLLRGYLQDGGHVEALEDNLRQTLTPPLTGRKWEWVRRQRDSADLNSGIVLHVRGGDYPIGLRLGSDYYKRALEAAAALGSVPTNLYVLSDDFEWASRILAGMGNLIHLVPPTGPSQVQEMLAASSARVVVTANSTFSFWIGLTCRREAQVVFPVSYGTQTRFLRSGLTRTWTAIE